MQDEATQAFFFWAGSPLPTLARLSILTAAQSGFDVTLYVDREQDELDPRIQQRDYREVYDRYKPEEIRLSGRSEPFYAGFSDVFRCAVLAQNDGWWFDCDTLILKPASEFRALSANCSIVVGREDDSSVANGVIGSNNRHMMEVLLEQTEKQLPNQTTFGDTGPRLLTKVIRTSDFNCKIVDPEYFYPIHYKEAEHLYLPSKYASVKEAIKSSYCISLWGEVLRRTGYQYLSPPAGSFLAEFIAKHDTSVKFPNQSEKMAEFLALNKARLEVLDSSSGTLALKTLAAAALKRLRVGPPRSF